jgi:hypothetical protein
MTGKAAGTATGTGLPPNFRLNLTGIGKKTAEAVAGDAPERPPPPKPDQPPPIAKHPRGATVQPPSRPAPAEPTRNATTLTRKNLVVGSESSDDDDLDLDLEMIPVGKEDPAAKDDAAAEAIEAPSIQVSNLPDLVVDDDEDMPGSGEAGKLSLLQDLLLSAELADEPPDEWTYRQFIKQFANSEASQEGPEGEDEGDDYSMDDETDEYD